MDEEPVRCVRCGKQAEGVVATPFRCLTCQIVTQVPPELAPRDRKVKRPLWPWLAGVGVLGAGVAGFVVWTRHQRAVEEREAQYPVAATESQLNLLDQRAAVWGTGKDKLGAALASLPAVETLHGTSPCTVSLALPALADLAPAPPGSFRELMEESDSEERLPAMLVAGGDLGQRVALRVDTLLAAAARGRFHSERAADKVLRAISLPLIVLQLRVDEKPEVMTADGRDVFRPGHRVGTAYVFDPATGALRCAGAFEAASSDEVRTLHVGFAGPGNDDDALVKDLDDNTLGVLKTSLRAVE